MAPLLAGPRSSRSGPFRRSARASICRASTEPVERRPPLRHLESDYIRSNLVFLLGWRERPAYQKWISSDGRDRRNALVLLPLPPKLGPLRLCNQIRAVTIPPHPLRLEALRRSGEPTAAYRRFRVAVALPQEDYAIKVTRMHLALQKSSIFQLRAESYHL